MSVSSVKIAKIKQIRELLEERPNFILSNVSRLDVATQNKLRADLSSKKVTLKVVKNNLFHIALKEKEAYKNAIEPIQNDLKYQIFIAFVGAEFSSAAKLLLDVKKEVEGLDVKSGCFEGNYIDLNEIKEYANLPSHEELLVIIARGVNTPATKLATGLKEIIASLARGIKAVAEKRAS